MVDPLDTPLFPGDMRPEVCLFWMAAACRAVKDFLDVVPPIFDGCTATLTSRDEERARDLYWGVVQNRTTMLSDAAALRRLDEASLLNPFIGARRAGGAAALPQPPLPQGEAARGL